MLLIPSFVVWRLSGLTFNTSRLAQVSTMPPANAANTGRPKRAATAAAAAAAAKREKYGASSDEEDSDFEAPNPK